MHVKYIKITDDGCFVQSKHEAFYFTKDCLIVYVILDRFPSNKNSIQEEIKSRLKLGNACYYSVQNLLSSSLLSKKLKIKI